MGPTPARARMVYTFRRIADTIVSLNVFGLAVTFPETRVHGTPGLHDYPNISVVSGSRQTFFNSVVV